MRSGSSVWRWVSCSVVLLILAGCTRGEVPAEPARSDEPPVCKPGDPDCAVPR